MKEFLINDRWKGFGSDWIFLGVPMKLITSRFAKCFLINVPIVWWSQVLSVLFLTLEIWRHYLEIYVEKKSYLSVPEYLVFQSTVVWLIYFLETACYHVNTILSTVYWLSVSFFLSEENSKWSLWAPCSDRTLGAVRVLSTQPAVKVPCSGLHPGLGPAHSCPAGLCFREVGTAFSMGSLFMTAKVIKGGSGQSNIWKIIRSGVALPLL